MLRFKKGLKIFSGLFAKLIRDLNCLLNGLVTSSVCISFLKQNQK